MPYRDSVRRDPLQPITQPQLPPSGVILARDMDLPGKVFRAKALLSRRASEQETLRVVEVCGDLGAEIEKRSCAGERAHGAMVVLDPAGKAEDYFSFNPLDAPAGADGDEAQASGILG